MALSEAQRIEVRTYLGWSDRFHQTDSRLEQALNAIDLRPDSLAKVVALLASITDIETKLEDAHGRLKARNVGSIALEAEIELGALRSEGRRFVGRMSVLLGVECRHDVFSGSLPTFRAGWGGPLMMG